MNTDRKSKMNFIRHIFVVFCVMTSLCRLYGQNSVSIGTEEINEDAVLQLVSPNNNQGLLVPRMNTSQREAMSPQDDDNGLLVYDYEQSSFFYWHSGSWNPLSNGPVLNISGSGAVTVEGSYPNLVIHSNPNDTSALNEIQDLLLLGDTLFITGNYDATAIDLSPYLDNTDDQHLYFNNETDSLFIENGNGVDLSDLVGDADADPGNEIQHLTFNSTYDSLFIEDGNGVDLSDLVDDADADPGNEIQHLTFNATYDSLFIENGNGVDLSDLVDDADADPGNEIQHLTFDATYDSLFIEDGNGVDLSDLVDDADADPGNEIQHLTFNATYDSLFIEDGNGVDLSDLVDDADADTTNEILTYGALINNELILSEGEDTLKIDVSELEDAFAGWDLEGNSGTDPLNNYIGTSDQTDLNISTNAINRITIDGTTGYVGINTGAASASQPLHVNGNARIQGDLQIQSAGYIDDDDIFGGNSDDWMQLNGYVQMKSSNQYYGLRILETNGSGFLNLTQRNGYSYLSDNTSSNNYFIRGNGGDVHVRYNLTTGRSISSGNGYSITSANQFLYMNAQTRYKTYHASSFVSHTGNPVYSTHGALVTNIPNPLGGTPARGWVHIDIPVNATITSINVRVVDNDAGGILNPDNNITVRLLRKYYSWGLSYNQVFSDVSTVNAPGYTTLTMSGSHTVVSSYAYFVEIDFEESSTDHGLLGVRVVYTVNRAD